MKIAAFFALILGFAVAASADTVTWNLDSTSGFDVTVVGQGSAWGANGYMFSLGAVSPSNLWNVTGGEMIFDRDNMGTAQEWLSQGPACAYYLPTDLPSEVPSSARGPMDGSGTQGQFLRDQVYSTYLGYLGDGYTAAPYAGEQISKGWSLSSGFGLASYGWSGVYYNTVTVVDPDDVSTWTDTLHMWGSGTDLGVSIPESGTSLALLGGALAVLGLLRLPWRKISRRVG